MAGMNEPRWIPVTERLPEIDVDVLVCYEGSMWVGSVGEDGEFRDEEGRMNCEYWMPLPEPPTVPLPKRVTLTDAEREAIEVAAEAYASDHGERFAEILRLLLKRSK